MSKAEELTPTVVVEGDLLFSTVVPKRESIVQQLQHLSGRCYLDFAKVGRVDSSALSLWLCLQRYAQSCSISLVVINLPEEMLSIAKLVGIDDQFV